MNDNELREIPFEKETIFEGHILHVEKWQVTCPNGHIAPREIVVHRGAAAVVPVYDDGTTLLVRQHRVSVDRVTLEIPAGKLDSWDEDPLMGSSKLSMMASEMGSSSSFWMVRRRFLAP